MNTHLLLNKDTKVQSLKLLRTLWHVQWSRELRFFYSLKIPGAEHFRKVFNMT